jgi:hypothetical protein
LQCARLWAGRVSSARERDPRRGRKIIETERERERERRKERESVAETEREKERERERERVFSEGERAILPIL